MKNPYYMIWADAIRRYQKHQPGDKNFVRVFFLQTWIDGLNLSIIVLWLKYFEIVNATLLSIDLFPGRLLDSLTEFIIQFVLFFGILNYFLIFHKKRYRRILLKYEETKTNYAFIYGITSVLFFFISIVMYGILT